MQCGHVTPPADLTKTLLKNYIEQRNPTYPCWNTADNSGSIVIGMASMWKVIL